MGAAKEYMLDRYNAMSYKQKVALFLAERKKGETEIEHLEDQRRHLGEKRDALLRSLVNIQASLNKLGEQQRSLEKQRGPMLISLGEIQASMDRLLSDMLNVDLHMPDGP